MGVRFGGCRMDLGSFECLYGELVFFVYGRGVGLWVYLILVLLRISLICGMRGWIRVKGFN